MDHPPLNTLRVFAAAARHLSFKDAADALCVTPGAVSRQIQALEAHLGLPLFERGFRSVALTQAGALYLAQVGPALEAIALASRRLRELARQAVVRVEATPALTMYWLIPRLAEFRALHPGIEVRLATAQGVVDRGRDADVFIRRDPAHFAALAATPFMTEYAALVASPAFLAARGIAGEAAVAGAPRLAMRSRPDLWAGWFARRGRAAAAPAMEFDNTILVIQAAIEGLGVALVPSLFLESLIDGGSLREVPGTAPFASGSYAALVRPEPSAEALAFVAWLSSAGDLAIAPGGE